MKSARNHTNTVKVKVTVSSVGVGEGVHMTHMRKKINSPCLGCGKEFMRYRGDLPYCEECLKPVKVYEPTPEQKKRMDQNMRKVNQALSKIF